MPKELERYYLEDKLEVGIDEAGRGPLFGRLYIGARRLYIGRGISKNRSFIDTDSLYSIR